LNHIMFEFSLRLRRLTNEWEEEVASPSSCYASWDTLVIEGS